MAFSSGLSVPTMSTHHPAPSRQRELIEKGKQREREWERDRVKPKLPKAACPRSLQDVRARRSWEETSSLFRSTASSSSHSYSLPPHTHTHTDARRCNVRGQEEDEHPIEESRGTLAPQGQGWDTNTQFTKSSSPNMFQGEFTQSGLFRLWSESVLVWFSRWKWWHYKSGGTRQLHWGLKVFVLLWENCNSVCLDRENTA